MIELRTPTSDDYPAMGRQIHESFGASEPDELQREQMLIDFDRFRIAYDTAARRATLPFRTYPDPSCQTPF